MKKSNKSPEIKSLMDEGLIKKGNDVELIFAKPNKNAYDGKKADLKTSGDEYGQSPPPFIYILQVFNKIHKKTFRLFP